MGPGWMACCAYTDVGAVSGAPGRPARRAPAAVLDLQGAQLPLAGGGLGALGDAPARPADSPRCMRSSPWRSCGQVSPVVVSATRTSTRAEPERDMGADALFFAVVDRAQV